MKTKVRLATNLAGFTVITVTVSKGSFTVVKTRKVSRTQISATAVELKADAVAQLAVIERALK